MSDSQVSCTTIPNETLLEQLDAMVTQRLDERLDAIETRIAEALQTAQSAQAGVATDRATIVVFSGDMDRLMGAFVIATGAAAMGMEVSMFFTFWGLAAVKNRTIYQGKPISEKMMAAMLPGGPESVGTSKLNMLGMGPAFFKWMMKQKNVQSLPELIELARRLDVKMVACEMSMGMMGIRRDELIDGLEYGGVATYLGDAADSRVSLFV